MKKELGAFYTPKEITEFLSGWVVDSDTKTILEPSAGEGRFVESLLNQKEVLDIAAVEINSEEISNLNKFKINVINGDFLNFYDSCDKKFDAVIGNPPYLTFDKLSKEQNILQQKVYLRVGFNPIKKSNLYSSFTIASIDLVKPGGKFAFVLPLDVLQSKDSASVREYIFDNMEEINIIKFNSFVFEEVEQAIILLFGIKKKDKFQETKIRVSEFNDLDSLNSHFEKELVRFSIHKHESWNKLFLGNGFLEFYNSKYKEFTNPLTNFVNAKLGLSTKDNKFFLVNKDIINEFDLHDFAIPVVQPRFHQSALIKEEDFKILEYNNKPIFILDFSKKELSDKQKEYCKKTEKGIYLKGLEASKGYMVRKSFAIPRMYRNDCNAVCIDSLLKVNFKEDVDKTIFLSYSSVYLLSTELNGKVMGKGVLEIFPNTIKLLRFPKLSDNKLDFSSLLEEVDKKLRNKESPEDIVKFVDNTIKPFLSFSDSELNLIYETWNRLRATRIKKE